MPFRATQLSKYFPPLNLDASSSHLSVLFGRFVPKAMFRPVDRDFRRRLRTYTPRVTFWTFLSQVFQPLASCREAVREFQAYKARASRTYSGLSASTSAYCQARQRISEPLLQKIHQQVLLHFQRPLPSAWLWHGRCVKLIDGTGATLADTPANQRLYPQHSEQKPGCGFPSMKLLGLFSLTSGAWLSVVKGNLHMHEQVLLHQLLAELSPLDIVVGDRALCSYVTLALLKQRGVDAAFRLHQARKVDFCRGDRLGKYDHVTTWHKPARRPDWLPEEIWQLIPPTLTVREVKTLVPVKGFRTKVLYLATTLLDANQFSSSDLAELYFQRWKVELFWKDIKITLAMDVFRCKTPEMVHKELWMHMIAYNLIRLLLLTTALASQLRPLQFSFKGALDTLRHWLPVLSSARNRNELQGLLAAMLDYLIRDQVPVRPNRSEPRARKRRQKYFYFLNQPRHLMGNLPHRNHPQQGGNNRA